MKRECVRGRNDDKGREGREGGIMEGEQRKREKVEKGGKISEQKMHTERAQG